MEEREKKQKMKGKAERGKDDVKVKARKSE